MLNRKVFLFIFSLILFSFQSGETKAQTGSALELLQLVNQFRINNGLPAFQANSALVSAAQNQANYMAEFSVFSSHVGYGGSTPQTRANGAGYNGFVVENIVGGTSMSPQQGLIWWRNSPIHYNTLVTSRYTEAGTAFSTNGESNFFVLVVGRKANSSAPVGGEDISPEPLYITPITLAEPNEDGSIIHAVQDGQALWSLAAHYEVSLNDLLLYNNFSETDFVQPGDEIIIRLADGQSPPPTPTPPLTHVVQEGQSLWSIALRFDLKFADLLLFNSLDETALLQPGQELIIRLAPGQLPPPTPTPIIFHYVTRGQTLWDIALANGLNLDELLSLNEGLTADSILQPGDEIQVRLPAPTTIPIVTPTAVSTTSPSTLPTPAASPTTTPAQVAEANNEPTSAPTPIPLQQLDEENGRSSLPTTLYAVAIILAIVGGGFLWWARNDRHES